MNSEPACIDALGPWPAPPMVHASIGLHVVAAASALLVPGAAPWALGAVALNHLALGSAGLVPRCNWLGPNVSRLPDAARSRGAMALTLDDGPDPDVTPAVLDVLDTLGMRATFFCIAERARTHAVLTRQIVARGHDVQNHSRHHRHNFALLGPRALQREIGDAQQMLADITGRLPHCFRAPAGLRNPFLDPVLHRLGLSLVSWTRRGFDTREARPQRVLARLCRGLQAGDILMLHDGHARHTVQGVPVLLQLLPDLIQRCRTAGLQGETLQQALPRRGDAVS